MHDPYAKNIPSPFFELLAQADDIKIQELPLDKEASTSALQRIYEMSSAEGRAFFIRIRSPKPTHPMPKPTDSPSSPENRSYLLKSADLLVGEGDFVLARHIYSYLLKVNLKDFEAMLGLGICFLKLGETTSAKKCFRALLETSDNLPAAHWWMANCYIIEKEDEGAVRELTLAAKLNCPVSLQFELQKELGNCKTRLSDFDGAWEHYHKAIAINPTSDTLFANLGTLEIQRKYWDAAASYFKKAIEINPKNDKAHCGLGFVLLEKQDKNQAIQEFYEALKINTQNVVALYQLIGLVHHSDELLDLKTRFTAFLDRDPKNHSIRFALGVIFFKENDWINAEAQVDKILTENPTHAKARALKDEIIHHKHLPL